VKPETRNPKPETPFDADNAYEYTRRLAFPRRTGSDGEAEAVRLITAAFQAMGLPVETQTFHFSPFPLTVGARLFLLGLAAFVVAGAGLFPRAPGWAAGLSGVAVILASLGSRWNKLTEKLYDLPPQWSASNLIARRLVAGADRDLVFLAHHDSKSQTQPLIPRLILFGLSFFGLVGWAGLLLLAALGHPSFISPRLIYGWSVAIVLAVALLQLNRSHNESPGALDNACGVGVLLELARCLPEVGLTRTNLTLVATGAEEEGLAGAVRFMQAYAPDFDRERTFFVNLDGPGAAGRLILLAHSGFPPTPTAPRLAPWVRDLARAQGQPISPVYLLIGAGTDQIPIAWRGFEALTLEHGHWGPAWNRVHSRRDNLANIDRAALRTVGEICVALARKIEQMDL